jgi:hypothetical protein
MRGAVQRVVVVVVGVCLSAMVEEGETGPEAVHSRDDCEAVMAVVDGDDESVFRCCVSRGGVSRRIL